MLTHPRCSPDGERLNIDDHDAPHHSAETEEWHISCHAHDSSGSVVSLFAAFHRIAVARSVDGPRRFAHAVFWAVTDPVTGAYHPTCLIDENMASHLRQRLHRQGESPVGRALTEVFDRGIVPLPDRAMESTPVVKASRLDLNFDGCTLTGLGDLYNVTLVAKGSDVSCRVQLRPQQSVARYQTGEMLSEDRRGLGSHYFLHNCTLSGHISLPGRPDIRIESTDGWFDHRFELAPRDLRNVNLEPPTGLVSANEFQRIVRLNIVLSDETAVSIYEITDLSTGETLDKMVVIVRGGGDIETASDIDVRPMARWRSPNTFQDYSTAYRLTSEKLNLRLELNATSVDQEFVTELWSPGFWEGRCTAEGVIDGNAVRGSAIVVQRGFNPASRFDAHLTRVGEAVVAAVDSVLPHPLTASTVEAVVGAAFDRSHRHVDAGLLSDAIVRPIRFITDRGGKAWRSYVLLACCEAVGGDSSQFREILAVPEIIHAGSLIIDDIEDSSMERRGGPACHVTFDQAVAMNAGNAAYFIAPNILMSHRKVMQKSDRVKVQLYELYLQAMCGAHAGQAMDLHGLHDLMPSVVASGRTEELEKRILSCYRLKTGVPAGRFAAMGAVLGDGTQEEVACIAEFIEAAGVAFQIVDDVLNLAGFADGQKATGEDIINGTITLPLARALSFLGPSERQLLWSRYRAASNDQELVPTIVDMLDRSGSFQSSRATAQHLIEESWAVIEKKLTPSHATVMLRAFSWFILERNY